MIKKNLCGMTLDEIFGLIQAEGYDLTHAVRIANSIYKKCTKDTYQIEGISKSLKEYLERIAETGIYAPAASEISADKTINLLRGRNLNQYGCLILKGKLSVYRHNQAAGWGVLSVLPQNMVFMATFPQEI